MIISIRRAGSISCQKRWQSDPVEAGATIHLSSGVEKLLTEGRKVKGIRLESGEEIQADEVVVNGILHK
ncbi:hypothetical protein ACEQPO_08720 [Bacillus sp. SL00103]